MITWQNNALTAKGRQVAIKQLLAMCIAVITFTLITYFIWGLSHAYSTLVGGAVAIVPNVVFAYKAFKYAGARAAKQVMNSFFSGVKLKLGLTALLFALAFKFLVLLPVPFFVGFCLVVVMPLLTPLFLNFNHWEK
ncbi:ATP synthase subunit I [Thalassotalea sp. G2M2-11]|uniref:ATP synthase subunit I n=1 Tax=Thalassotalea sp. G2M2-11 TaxID=2787627 RepID=UPI003216ED0C